MSGVSLVPKPQEAPSRQRLHRKPAWLSFGFLRHRLHPTQRWVTVGAQGTEAAYRAGRRLRSKGGSGDKAGSHLTEGPRYSGQHCLCALSFLRRICGTALFCMVASPAGHPDYQPEQSSTRSKSAAPGIFQSLLEMRSTFFCRERLSMPLLMQITKSGLSIFHILTV